MLAIASSPIAAIIIGAVIGAIAGSSVTDPDSRFVFSASWIIAIVIACGASLILTLFSAFLPALILLIVKQIIMLCVGYFPLAALFFNK